MPVIIFDKIISKEYSDGSWCYTIDNFKYNMFDIAKFVIQGLYL